MSNNINPTSVLSGHVSDRIMSSAFVYRSAVKYRQALGRRYINCILAITSLYLYMYIYNLLLLRTYLILVWFLCDIAYHLNNQHHDYLFAFNSFQFQLKPHHSYGNIRCNVTHISNGYKGRLRKDKQLFSQQGHL